jgi:hypothetical protein
MTVRLSVQALEQVSGGVLNVVPGGTTLRGAYQQWDFEGQRQLAIFAPQGAFNGRHHFDVADDIASQAARQYFDQNPGRQVGVDVFRTDDQGNVVGRYGFLQSAREETSAPWMLRDDQVRPFLQPQVQAMREQSNYADRLFEERMTEQERLTSSGDPNDEGYRLFDLQHRQEQAYNQLGTMAESYVATRDATPPLDSTIQPFDYTVPRESNEGYNAPSYTAPTYNEPVYEEPTYQEPGNIEPTTTAPTYEEPPPPAVPEYSE